MSNFHFFFRVPNALVYFQHILLGLKPSYLCVSIRDGCLYPSVPPDLESKILEGSIHVRDLGGQKQQKIRSRKDFWWNAIGKWMEKEANVTQHRSEEEESHLRVNSFTERSQHIRSSIQHHQTGNIWHFHSAFGDVCTHDHIWFSQREILGGGVGKGALFLLGCWGEWGSEKGPAIVSSWPSRLWKYHFSQQSSLQCGLKCIISC